MEKIKLLALFGESSAGKDTIQHWLVQNIDNANKIISYTTRPPRHYEKDGINYHFITIKDFEQYIVKDEMLEFTIFNNWYYGTPIDELKTDKINVGVFNPCGIKSLLYHNNIDVLPVWIQTNDKIRLLRSLNREQNPNCEEICRRFLADKKDFSNINFNYETYLNNSEDNNYYGILNRPKIANFIKA